MKLAVTDANIFIDLILLGVLAHLFDLGIEVYTTQDVVDQLNEAQLRELKPYISATCLRVYSFNREEYAKVVLMEAPRSLGLADQSVAWLSIHLGAMVLTGDGALRNFCKLQKLEVRGIVWFFDQTVELALLDPVTAAAKLESLLSLNGRLPKDEIHQRIHKWRNM